MSQSDITESLPAKSTSALYYKGAANPNSTSEKRRKRRNSVPPLTSLKLQQAFISIQVIMATHGNFRETSVTKRSRVSA